MLGPTSKRVENHTAKLLSYHPCSKLNMKKMETYVFEKDIFVKAFPAKSKAAIAEIQEYYAQKSALPPSDYVVRVSEYVSTGNNLYCIHDHCCKYGHIVHLRKWVHEDNRTLDYEEFYQSLSIENLDEQTVVNILRATVHTIQMVKMQASILPNYTELLFKLDIKGILVCGTLPDEPIIRLSGFSLKENHDDDPDEDPNDYWDISDTISQNKLVWFLGKVAFYLLTDTPLEDLPLRFSTEQAQTFPMDKLSPNPKITSKTIHRFLQRALISNDMSWLEFITGLESYPDLNVWKPKEEPNLSTTQFVVQKINQPMQSVEPQILVQNEQQESPELRPIMMQQTSTNPFEGPDDNDLMEQEKNQVISIRNRLEAELKRLKESTTIACKVSGYIEKLLLKSQNGLEVMHFFSFNMMIFHKCRQALTAFQSDLQKQTLPDIIYQTSTALFEQALKTPDPFCDKVQDFSLKLYERTEKHKATFCQNFSVRMDSLPGLLHKNALHQMLTYQSDMSDRKKVAALLRNAWIDCYNFYKQNHHGRVESLPELHQEYQKLLLYGHHLINGPLFTPLDPSVALPDSLIDEKEATIVADLSNVKSAVENTAAERFDEMTAALTDSQLKLEVWSSKAGEETV